MSDNDSDDMDYEAEKAKHVPERRAPSGRASKGNRMARLVAEEVDAVDGEDDADKDFYKQGFWADEEEDGDFNADADDEEGRDSFDSDFGDSTESSSDEEGGEEKVKKKVPSRKGVYKDPKKIAHKKGTAGGADADAKPKASKKRARPEGDQILPPAERSRESLRASTQGASEAAAEKQRRLEEEAKVRAERAAAAGAKRGVELRRLTQADILAEAIQTEIINKASLERMLRQEEDKRRVISRERNTDGPRIVWRSKRVGEVVQNTVTFTDAPIPAAIDDVVPPYPQPQRCAVTGAPAKYRDPATGAGYATLEAFRMLRGRTGRRQHSFGGAGPSGAGTPADD